MKPNNIIPYEKIEIMVIPTDYCNMSCIYCFNGRKNNSLCSKIVMSEDTLRQLCKVTIPYYKEVRFLWHGGEPLAAGKDFYEKVFEIQKEVQNSSSTDTKVINIMQSNLTLLTTDFAEFLVDHQVRVGGSFDGITNEETRGCTEAILRGYENYKAAGGNIGFIYVAQSHNIDCLIEDYEWFKAHGINYAINSYKSSHSGEKDALDVPSEKYAEKMCALFDYWFFDKECRIHVGPFEHFIRYFVTGKKSVCNCGSCLGKYLGIYPNGDIYNCNRDFPKEYCYGNIADYTDIHECFNSAGFQKMLEGAYLRRQKCRDTCKIYPYCAGGCNSDALMGGNLSTANKNICDGLIEIYNHIYDIINKWKQSPDAESRLNPFVLTLLRENNEN